MKICRADTMKNKNIAACAFFSLMTGILSAADIQFNQNQI